MSKSKAESKARIAQEDSKLIFKPISEPQSQFLTSDAWLTIYGGAAFSGKSHCLLGSLIPIIDDPNTAAVCIRKTTKQLSGTGGLWDRAIELFRKFDSKLKINSNFLTLTFSSGAKVQFTYLDKESDRDNVHGKEFTRILFDEAQEMSGSNIFYALGRLRSTRVKYPLQAFATCNPDPDCWIMPFVEHILDEEKIPIRQDVYNKRYFVNQGGTFLFYDNYEDAKKIYGSGIDSPIKNYRFIPGTIYDNPLGLEKNQDYIGNLKTQPRVDMLRLLHGAWVRDSSSGFFKREWVKMVDHPEYLTNRRVRSWDLAASEPTEANPRVDATAGVLMSKNKYSMYTVEDVVHIRKRIHEVERTIFETAERDGRDVIITLPLDPGATAGAYCKDLAKRLAERGFTARLIRPEKGKLQRFRPVASVAEAGFLNVVRAHWNEAYFNELESTEFSKRTFDDQADATSDAFYQLNRNLILPDVNLSDSNSFVSSYDFSSGF